MNRLIRFFPLTTRGLCPRGDLPPTQPCRGLQGLSQIDSLPLCPPPLRRQARHSADAVAAAGHSSATVIADSERWQAPRPGPGAQAAYLRPAARGRSATALACVP
jgi:hypothetical protein